MVKELLFVSGTPRSGTSALVRMLNLNPAVMIGMERYFSRYKKGGLDSSFFDADRFLDVQENDTHAKGGFGIQDAKKLRERYERAQIIGDKYPLLYLQFDEILTAFPEARHVFIIRNPLSVAESYQERSENPADSFNKDYRTAIEEWNKGLDAMLALPEAVRAKFCVVEYESIFKSATEINRLFTFLGLSTPEAKALAGLKERANDLEQTLVPRRDDLRAYVTRNAKWGLYKRFLRELSSPVQHQYDQVQR
ncbi:Sulfotransferase family [Roseovarius mucosus DSM 17069]|uniref:Sulfotransferase family n=1 Tax=Roseovarius mucosus DSM 17069 TaxID=1288298 RepID=A0A0A0HME8_9RHOB|nr:sulfotransferase [Roseovarius mucosus]KGM87298.1 Sulfotransferase family [Roseovarius mucosus DSM 17069]